MEAITKTNEILVRTVLKFGVKEMGMAMVLPVRPKKLSTIKESVEQNSIWMYFETLT